MLCFFKTQNMVFDNFVGTNKKADMKIIEIQDVTKTYRLNKKTGNIITAINHVSLDIEDGEILGLLGANGAGKTTLIKIMLDLIKTDSGRIIIDGYDVAKHREKALKEVGAIVEEPTLFSDFTGMENLKYFAKLQNAHINEEKIKSIVKLVGLEDRIDSKFKSYSLGMRQRLGIAQALIHSPKILMLDEPTNGLDPNGIIEMRELFKSLKNELGITIIISSHILSEMQQLCDRVAFMVKGEIKAVKTMDEVNFGVDKLKKFALECGDLQKAKKILEDMELSVQKSENMLIIRATQSDISKAIKALVQNDIDIYSLARQKRKLEDLYNEVSLSKSISEEVAK